MAPILFETKEKRCDGKITSTMKRLKPVAQKYLTALVVQLAKN